MGLPFIIWAISTRRELAEVEEKRLFHIDTGLEAVSRVTPIRNVLLGLLCKLLRVGLDIMG